MSVSFKAEGYGDTGDIADLPQQLKHWNLAADCKLALLPDITPAVAVAMDMLLWCSNHIFPLLAMSLY